MKKIILLLLISSIVAFAGVGKITAIKGEVYIDRQSKQIPARVGSILELQDKIITKAKSKALLLFNDKTSITVGKNSNLQVQKYVFSPTVASNNQASFKFGQGVFRTLTGKIGKLNKKKFQIKTATASIGIRGTVFDVFVNKEGLPQVGVLSGKVAMKFTPEMQKEFGDQEIEVGKGQSIVFDDTAPAGQRFKVVDKPLPQTEELNQASADLGVDPNAGGDDDDGGQDDGGDDEGGDDEGGQDDGGDDEGGQDDGGDDDGGQDDGGDDTGGDDQAQGGQDDAGDDDGQAQGGQDDTGGNDGQAQGDGQDQGQSGGTQGDDTQGGTSGQNTGGTDGGTNDGGTSGGTTGGTNDGGTSGGTTPPASTPTTPKSPLDGDPDIPDQPDTPDVPDVPDQPDTPDIPDIPDTPDPNDLITNTAPTIDTINGNSLDEDTEGTINVIASDAQSDTLTYSLDKGPENGTAAIDPVTGIITYTPNENFNGEDSVIVSVSDGSLSSGNKEVTITVSPVNDLPTFSEPEIPEILEDAESSMITFSATDVDNDTLTYSIESDAQNGVLAIESATGQVIYIPNENFNGEETISIKVSDGTEEGTEIKTVILSVTSVNDDPVFESVTVPDEILEDGGEYIITMSSSDIEDGELTYSIESQPENDTVAIDPQTGELKYTPAENFNGTALIKVKVSDSEGGESIKEIEFNVESVNDNPTLDEISIPEILENEQGTIILSLSDIDEGDDVTYSIDTQPANGTASIDPVTGGIIYIPNDGHTGDDTLTILISDGNGGEITYQIDLSVTATNDDPVFGTITIPEITEDTTEGTIISVTATDGDEDKLTYSITAEPSNGTATIDPETGEISYIPNSDFSGTDTITVEVSDGNGGVVSQEITITVTNVNDAPTIVIDTTVSYEVYQSESTSIAFTLSDIDVDDTVSVESVSASSGTVVISGDTIIYTANSTFVGTASITITYTDGTETVTETFYVSVLEVQQAADDTPQDDTPEEDLNSELDEITYKEMLNTGDTYMEYGFELDVSSNRIGTYITGDITPSGIIEEYMTNQNTATYSGGVAAMVNGVDSTGDVSLTVNFGAQTITGTLNVTQGDWQTSLSNGSVNPYGFSADLSGTVGGVSDVTGDMDGKFYGPEALKAGGDFQLNSPTGGSATGVFGGTAPSIGGGT